MIEDHDFVSKNFIKQIMEFNQLILGNIQWSQFFTCPTDFHIYLLILLIWSTYIQMENWKTNKGDLLHYYIFQSSDDWRYWHNYNLTTKRKEKIVNF